MNTENIELLQYNLNYLGFTEKLGLNDQLVEQMAREPDAFQLYADTLFEDDYKLEAILHFRRSGQLDMYFLNKYTARLHSDKRPDLDRIHTFFIIKGAGVTLREAFNLLQGRAVNKDFANMDGQKYNAWMQLNLREKDEFNNFLVNKFRERYGYNLEKALEKYPIRELRNEEQRVNLIKNLKKGNQCLV